MRSITTTLIDVTNLLENIKTAGKRLNIHSLKELMTTSVSMSPGSS